MNAVQTGEFKDQADEATCKAHAGKYFPEVVRSYDAAWASLRHPDPRARLGGLAAIKLYWQPTPDFYSLCEKLVAEDGDLDVRGSALNCLISRYYGTCDKRISHWLAKLVRNDAEPLEVRSLSYCVLFAVNASSPHARVNRPLPTALRFPQEVDWAFVDAFLS